MLRINSSTDYGTFTLEGTEEMNKNRHISIDRTKNKKSIFGKYVVFIGIVLVIIVIVFFLQQHIDSVKLEKQFNSKANQRYTVQAEIHEVGDEDTSYTIEGSEEYFLNPFCEMIKYIFIVLIGMVVGYFSLWCYREWMDRKGYEMADISHLLYVVGITIVVLAIAKTVYLENMVDNVRYVLQGNENKEYYTMETIPSGSQYLRGKEDETLLQYAIIHGKEIVDVINFIILIEGALILPFKYHQSVIEQRKFEEFKDEFKMAGGGKYH